MFGDENWSMLIVSLLIAVAVILGAVYFTNKNAEQELLGIKNYKERIRFYQEELAEWKKLCDCKCDKNEEVVSNKAQEQ